MLAGSGGLVGWADKMSIVCVCRGTSPAGAWLKWRQRSTRKKGGGDEGGIIVSSVGHSIGELYSEIAVLTRLVNI